MGIKIMSRGVGAQVKAQAQAQAQISNMTNVGGGGWGSLLGFSGGGSGSVASGAKSFAQAFKGIKPQSQPQLTFRDCTFILTPNNSFNSNTLMPVGNNNIIPWTQSFTPPTNTSPQICSNCGGIIPQTYNQALPSPYQNVVPVYYNPNFTQAQPQNIPSGSCILIPANQYQQMLQPQANTNTNPQTYNHQNQAQPYYPQAQQPQIVYMMPNGGGGAYGPNGQYNYPVYGNGNGVSSCGLPSTGNVAQDFMNCFEQSLTPLALQKQAEQIRELQEKDAEQDKKLSEAEEQNAKLKKEVDALKKADKKERQEDLITRRKELMIAFSNQLADLDYLISRGSRTDITQLQQAKKLVEEYSKKLEKITTKTITPAEEKTIETAEKLNRNVDILITIDVNKVINNKILTTNNSIPLVEKTPTNFEYTNNITRVTSSNVITSLNLDALKDKLKLKKETVDQLNVILKSVYWQNPEEKEMSDFNSSNYVKSLIRKLNEFNDKIETAREDYLKLQETADSTGTKADIDAADAAAKAIKDLEIF